MAIEPQAGLGLLIVQMLLTWHTDTVQQQAPTYISGVDAATVSKKGSSDDHYWCPHGQQLLSRPQMSGQVLDHLMLCEACGRPVGLGIASLCSVVTNRNGRDAGVVESNARVWNIRHIATSP